MAIHRLQTISQTSSGVSLPKKELELEGLIGPDGKPKDGQNMLINYNGDGEWIIRAC